MVGYQHWYLRTKRKKLFRFKCSYKLYSAFFSKPYSELEMQKDIHLLFPKNPFWCYLEILLIFSSYFIKLPSVTRFSRRFCCMKNNMQKCDSFIFRININVSITKIIFFDGIDIFSDSNNL